MTWDSKSGRKKAISLSCQPGHEDALALGVSRRLLGVLMIEGLTFLHVKTACFFFSSCHKFTHVLQSTISYTKRNIHTHNKNSREDLMNRIQTDIPKFSPAETSLEVDKFLMDGEMLDTFIKYNQRKAEDPDWEPEYAEQDNSPVTAVVNFVSQYGIFVVGGILIKDIVTSFMDKNGGGGEGAEVLVSSALDGVHHLSNILV